MPHGLQGQTSQISVCFLTEPSLQAQAFISLLQNETTIPIQLHNIRTPLPAMLTAGTLVLFDAAAANKRLITFWKNVLGKHTLPIKVLLMNIDDHARGKTLSEWPALSEIFYRSDTQLHVLTRIKETLLASFSQTAHLAPDLLKPQESDNILLTVREKQILSKLCMGATNSTIACTLFISEHTVRTHIYNIYKKIKVKNRTQAVYWVSSHVDGPV